MIANETNEVMRVCSKCGIEKPQTEEYFYFRQDRNAFDSVCHGCKKEYNKQYNKKNKDIIKEKNKIRNILNKEKNKKKRKEYYEKNRKNIISKQKDYTKKNYDLVLEYQKRYRKENKANLNDYCKEYATLNTRKNIIKRDNEIFDGTSKICSRCGENKPKTREFWNRKNLTRDGINIICKQCCNSASLDKLHSNIEFKIRSYISTTIRNLLKRSGSSKNGSSILQKLPYTMHQLKEHLESLWEDWMNWDNYGPIDLTRDTWQIDHKIPCSAFPYDSMDHPNFLKCWDLNNLQPMRAMDNIKKSNKTDNNSEKL